MTASIFDSDNLLESLREEFLRAASKHVPTDRREAANKLLGKYTLSNVSLANLVNIFEQVTGRHFFIHLDEMSSTPAFRDVTTEVKLLHQIWIEIKTARFKSQSEVFCSGRSAALFLMDKGHDGYGGMTSPENAACVLLDLLDNRHIAEIFADFGVSDEQKFIGLWRVRRTGVHR